MQAGGWSDSKVVGAEGTSSLSCVEVHLAFSTYSADGMVTESPQTAGMGSNIPSLTRPLDSGCGCRQGERTWKPLPRRHHWWGEEGGGENAVGLGSSLHCPSLKRRELIQRPVWAGLG